MTDTTESVQSIVRIVQENFPTVQAIYLYGSWGTSKEWPDSDVDIGILLSPAQAKTEKYLMMHPVAAALASALHKEVDVVNLRLVSTVLRAQVIGANRRIFTGDAYAAAEFEMVTLSLYQRLNLERREIVEKGLAGGRFYSA